MDIDIIAQNTTADDDDGTRDTSFGNTNIGTGGSGGASNGNGSGSGNDNDSADGATYDESFDVRPVAPALGPELKSGARRIAMPRMTIRIVALCIWFPLLFWSILRGAMFFMIEIWIEGCYVEQRIKRTGGG